MSEVYRLPDHVLNGLVSVSILAEAGGVSVLTVSVTVENCSSTTPGDRIGLIHRQ